MTKHNQKRIQSLLIASFVCIAIGIIGEHFPESSYFLKRKAKVASYHLNEQLDQTKGFSKALKNNIENNQLDEFYALSKELDQNINVLLYNRSKLIHWNSSQVPTYKRFFHASRNAPNQLVLLENGWYWREYEALNDTMSLIKLIQIKREYSYENRFLQPKFLYPIDSEIELAYLEGEPVCRKDGEELFYLVTPQNNFGLTDSLAVFEIIFIIGIVLLLSALRIYLREREWKNRYIPFLITIGTILTLFCLQRFCIFPVNLRELAIFSSFTFAYSFSIASIGDIVVVSLLSGYSALILWDISKKIALKPLQKIDIILYSAYAVLQFLVLLFFLSTLVNNSTLNFRFATDLSFSIVNGLAFISVIIFYFSLTSVLFSLNHVVRKRISIRKIALVLFAASELCYSFLLDIDVQLWIPHLLFLACTLFAVFHTSTRVYVKYQFYYLILLAILGTVVTNYTFFHLDKKRDKETQELLCENLVYERDAAAELFIENLEIKLLNDSVILEYLVPPYDVLGDYIGKKYMQTGSLRNYDYQITICGQSDSLNLADKDDIVPCYDFFREMMLRDGVMIPNTNFYYLDKLDGVKSYVGSVDLNDVDLNYISIFIELSSRLVSEGAGYPELLLDEKVNRSKLIEGFSYGKYHNGYLVDRKGKFDYPIKRDAFPECSENGKVEFEKNGYNHLLSHIENNNFIIVSRECPSLKVRILSFPYSFILFYIVGLCLLIPPFFMSREGNFHIDLKQRIQYTMVIFELVTIGLIGIGISYYNVNEYRQQLGEKLNDKVQSIKASLESNMFNSKMVDNNMVEFFNFEFIRLSEIFHTDIHLYSTEGKLLATSRSEVFDNGLIGTQMNPIALDEMIRQKQPSFQHEEEIGSLSFYSVYEPLVNYRGDVIGYMNIPYFSNPDELINEISSFVITLINIFILFAIFTFFLALLVSKRITSPLSMLEQRLRSIQFGRSNAKIEMDSHDEIGRLVEAYNHKIDELVESASKLAKSERESAWREMARQVAHEIKNPLTPMKLSIQYLQLAQLQKRDNFEVYFKQVTGTLIEQIENLSKIATSFSDFAKIPKADREKIDLFAKLREIETLMNKEGDIEITTEQSADLFIYFDKEHFSRILINLIKNGQQATVDKRSSITISVDTKGLNCIIAIKDNGAGIDDAVAERLFTPYFTTKNSGTGLGLAITKSLIENGQGKIWFKTELGVGTTFFLQLPLFKS